MSLEKRIAELEAQLAEREAQLAERDTRIAQLEEQVKQLQKQVEELKRSGKRQATPFSRNKSKEKPKKPGRKAGQGHFSHRVPPSPEEVNETKEEPLNCCPSCGGCVKDLKQHEHYEVDIPPVVPIVTKYITYSGTCCACGQSVQSRHAEQISEATGAAGVVIGPRAKALSIDLKHRLGLSYGKVCDLFGEAFGLKVSRGCLFQAGTTIAKKARPAYNELIETLSKNAAVYSDETGWRIGTLSAWLWVFTNRETTVYTIRRNRGHEVVLDILGEEFSGTLVSDRFSAYDHKKLSGWLKQKCVAHLLRNLSELKENKRAGAVRFAQDVTKLLKKALQLKKEKAKWSQDGYLKETVILEGKLDRLVDENRQFRDEENARFAMQLRKQRGHLLRFLYDDEVDGTNNQAERQLRPGVISRKTTGCNRTDGGAETHSILASLLATCKQRAISILDFFSKLQLPSKKHTTLPPPQPKPG